MFHPIAEASRQSLEPRSRPTYCEPTRAKAYALSLLGSYRTTDVDDPAVYVANAVAVLTRYREEVVAQVCGPGTGIQTRQKWLPTVSEIREACELAVQDGVDRERRRQLAEHRVLIDTRHGPMPEPEFANLPEDERKRIVAGFDGLQTDLRPARRKAPTAANAEQLERLRRHYAANPFNLSPEIAATNAGRPMGAPDLRYGPAAQAEAAE